VLATLINGEPDELIPVADRGFHYGDGVFETIRVVNRQPTLWSLHQQRLNAGCEFLKIPMRAALLEQDMHRLLTENEPCGVVKIVVSRGVGGRGYKPPGQSIPLRVLQFFPLPESLGSARDDGVRVKTCNHPLSRNGQLVNFKHLCRVDQVIASAELSPSFAEGIMLTEDGEVVEGTRSNLFMVLKQGLVTPALTTAGVRGVMREYLLGRFAADGVAVKERRIDLPELLTAEGLFLCNSVFGVWPVAELVNGENIKQFQVGRYTQTACKFAEEAFAVQA
jgi:4-amino-4-deoxychorismate lyase